MERNVLFVNMGGKRETTRASESEDRSGLIWGGSTICTFYVFSNTICSIYDEDVPAGPQTSRRWVMLRCH